MNPALIRVNGISVSYGKNEVFSNLSFDVNAGDYIGIVGPNGSGKTTLMKALLNLIPLSNGHIEMADNSTAARSIGYLPQKILVTDRLFPAKVKEIIRTGLLGNSQSFFLGNRNEMQQVDKILKRLQIESLKDKRIGDLSGGQQQRVLLARAMVSDPKVLILDEPTSALDPKVREDFYQLIKELNENDGVTILLVSHDVSTIGQYTKKMMYIDRGIVFYGDYEAFCQSSEMTKYFGISAQHQYCWRHGHE